MAEFMRDHKSAAADLGDVVAVSNNAPVAEANEAAVSPSKRFVPDDRAEREGDFLDKDLSRPLDLQPAYYASRPDDGLASLTPAHRAVLARAVGVPRRP